MEPEAKELLAHLDVALQDDLAKLCAELLRWNQTHNLTGHRNERDVVVNLFLDGLALAEQVHGGSLLDIGSGAGFPGLVLALALPRLRVTMLEPRAKRVSFQQHAVRLLGLGDRVRPVCGRTDGGSLAGEQFDTVILRAVGSLQDSLDLARPFVTSGGWVVLPRGASDREAALALGLTVADYTLPALSSARFFAIAKPNP